MLMNLSYKSRTRKLNIILKKYSEVIGTTQGFISDKYHIFELLQN